MIVLKDRQLDILNLIIQMYTQDRQPVGSKALVTHGINASSATIRNDMSTLEKMGLLEKAHTSSGRIPTMNGLRFYIDHLILPEHSGETNVHKEKLLPDAIEQLDSFLQKYVERLAQLTHFTVFATAPDTSLQLLTSVQMVPLNANQQIVLLIKDKGQVESRIVTGLSQSDFASLHKVIEDYLVGNSQAVITSIVKTTLPQFAHQYFERPVDAIDILYDLFFSDNQERFFVSGKLNILEYSHLSNHDDLRNLYHILSVDSKMLEFFQENAQEDPIFSIKIGEELGNPLFSEMSLLSIKYPVENHGSGRLAILGPANMDYLKTVSLLKQAAAELESSLNEYYRYLDAIQ